MRRFLQKLIKGSARNSRLINCADVTKIRKTRMFEVVWAKYARELSRSHAHNTHSWKHVISLKSTKAIVKAVYHYYYGDILAAEKEEIADSILYQTLDVFFEILNHCSQNSSRGGHYSCGWRSSEINRWFCKDLDKAFISYSAVPTVCRSSNASPLPHTFSTLFLFRDNFDGEVFL